MTVNKYSSLIGSHYYKSPTGESTHGVITMQLTGNPSQNTPKGFSLAYLNFVDSAQPLKRPQVVESSGYLILNIDYPLSYLATVERMLREAKVCYCWILNYSNTPGNITNIHADIHTEY